MIRVVNVRGRNTPEERAAVCYCGRRFAGWPKSPWHNPYARDGALDRFRLLVAEMGRQGTLEPWLAQLWVACEYGAKPLGCWCVNATAGDGSPVVCHAQVLAELLRERFDLKQVIVPREESS